MANPKRKFSHSRTAKRHSQWKLKGGPISFCPQCKHPKPSHTICTNCGFYNNELVLSMTRATFREKRKERKKGPPPEEGEKKKE